MRTTNAALPALVFVWHIVFLSLFAEVFRPFAFNVIVNMVEFKSTIEFAISSCLV